MSYTEFFPYFLKANALLAVFWLLYRWVLSKETFFTHNRFFLLSGIVISILLPLCIIERTEIIEIAVGSREISASGGTSVAETQDLATSLGTALFYIYLGGTVLFSTKLLIQLASLRRILRKGSARVIKGMKIIRSKEAEAPFSFFNYIVLPYRQSEQKEQVAVLSHEFVHVKQWHSADIMLNHLLTIFAWINPIAWLYRKDVAQNLEYLADREASTRKLCSKEYQYILVKQNLNTQQLSIINPFINSLIKKRIVMLHQNPSKKTNIWKLSLALPFLTAFVFLFNLKTVAQYQVSESAKGPQPSSQINPAAEAQEEFNFIITNEMSDSELKELKEQVAEKGGKLVWNQLSRNKQGVITKMQVTFTHASGTASATHDNKNGIEPFSFGVKADGGIFIMSGDRVEKKEYVVLNEITGTTSRGKKPIVIVDENESTTVTVKSIDPDQIESVTVLKGKQATDKYGEKGSDGVIEVHTKTIKSGSTDVAPPPALPNISLVDWDETAVYIDDKKAGPEELKALQPDQIDKMKVLKGEEAQEKYGKPSAILIYTK
ncbi:M56 family metallopeptidase [Robertkochia aurantiaca]|uniref:M56 family metallopeptidase n=1 Tax=Robertkochia aurantiaca TaxID=2873700 RepID=UPI001CC91F15|nr:M56 family metallopeptidase [Robertkochia sp. 3YJGBD-33]